MLAYITPAGEVVDGWLTSAPQQLPSGRDATWAALQPVTGRVVYGSVTAARISAPPYATTEEIALPPSTPKIMGAEWQTTGDVVWLRMVGTGASVDVATTSFRRLRFAQGGVDARGGRRVYLGGPDDAEIYVGEGVTTAPRSCSDPTMPRPSWQHCATRPLPRSAAPLDW